MKCPRCQSQNREGVRFCEECGARLVTSCSSCGAELLPDKRFCGSCGSPTTPEPVERHEVRIELEGDTVRDVRADIRRYRLGLEEAR